MEFEYSNATAVTNSPRYYSAQNSETSSLNDESGQHPHQQRFFDDNNYSTPAARKKSRNRDNEDVISDGSNTSSSSIDAELREYYNGDRSSSPITQLSPMRQGFPVPPRLLAQTPNYSNDDNNNPDASNVTSTATADAPKQLTHQRHRGGAMMASTYENVFDNGNQSDDEEDYVHEHHRYMDSNGNNNNHQHPLSGLICALGHLNCTRHPESVLSRPSYVPQHLHTNDHHNFVRSPVNYVDDDDIDDGGSNRTTCFNESTTASVFDRHHDHIYEQEQRHNNQMANDQYGNQMHQHQQELQFCNEFSATVAAEYVALYNFAGLRVDAALRRFLSNFALHGETQERERVLMHFSRRYINCNPSLFDSEDDVHTLVCAIMLLNTDLHAGVNVGGSRRMTCRQFIDNLGQIKGFSCKRDLLKMLYTSIREQPIEYMPDSVSSVATTSAGSGGGAAQTTAGSPAYNTSMLRRTGSHMQTTPDMASDIEAHVEYKKGWVMRKCDRLEQGKRAPFGRRGWRMFYATLKGMLLYLHKDDCGFKKGAYQTYRNGIRIHHAYAYAPNAKYYNKRQHVFAVRTADQCEYLFQTSGPAEVLSWIDMLNFVAASFSSPPLPAPVGSNVQCGQFHKPLLPAAPTKLPLDAQIVEHEHRVGEITTQLAALHADAPPRTAKGQRVMEFFQKERYLEEEKQRYTCYASLLRERLPKPTTVNPIAIAGAVTSRPLGTVNVADSSLLMEAHSSFDTDVNAGRPPHYESSVDDDDNSSGGHQRPCASHQSDRLSYREAVDDYEPPTHHQSMQ